MQNTYFRPKQKTFSRNLNKEANIENNILRKERGIKGSHEFRKQTEEEKRISIAISSAFNGACDICTALLNTNQLKIDDFWTKHKEVYDEYLELFATAQSEDVVKYKQMVGTLQSGEQISQETPQTEPVIEF